MDNIQYLLIRACKSQNPYQRLLTLHRRYWLTMSKADTDKCLVIHLGKIIDNHCPMKMHDFVDGLNPDNRWKLSLDTDSDYLESVWRLFTQHLRLAEIKHFPNYPVPRRWREAA